MPLNGLRIGQAYNTSPYVNRDSFAPSPFPDETTQGVLTQAAVDQAAAATTTTVGDAVNALTPPPATPDDGIGPNSIYLDVTPTLSGLKIIWNGLDTVGGNMPADFDRVDVHVSSVGGFIPSDATKIGRLFSAGTLYYFSNGVYSRYYVKGIAYDKAGNPSPLSNQISDQPRQILGSDITANTITANNILAGSVTADRIATGLLYAGVKIVVGSYTNNTARIEIDQQTGINLISRSITGVDTTTVSLNTLSGVGSITGGTITGTTVTGSTVQTATSGQRIVLSPSSNQVIFYSGDSAERSAGYFYSDVFIQSGSRRGRMTVAPPTLANIANTYSYTYNPGIILLSPNVANTLDSEIDIQADEIHMFANVGTSSGGRIYMTTNNHTLDIQDSYGTTFSTTFRSGSGLCPGAASVTNGNYAFVTFSYGPTMQQIPALVTDIELGGLASEHSTSLISATGFRMYSMTDGGAARWTNNLGSAVVVPFIAMARL